MRPLLRILAALALLLIGWSASLAAASRQDAAKPTSSPPAAIPAARAAKTIGVITVSGPIDSMTLQSIQRRIDVALRDRCDAVVIELDTPGGDLGATLAICHLLKTHAPLNKVAWVHPHAFSAGAIIALACREVVVSDASSIGDAAPIAISPSQELMPLPTTERAKLESPVLAEVTESAALNGHDVRLVRAFIRVSDELWLIERDDGKRLFADAREYEIAFGEPPSRSGSTRAIPEPPESSPRWAPPSSSADADSSLDDAFPPTDEEIAMEQFVHEPRVTVAEEGRWKLLGQVDTADELVTLRGREAHSFGLAHGVVNNDAELLQFFGGQQLHRYDESWSESLVRFLISWPIRILLIVIVIVSFVIEMITPGVGIFGTVAFVGFLTLVGAPALAGLADWWEILCIVLGLGLIAIEFLVTPGMGIAGLAGGLLLLLGLVFSFTGGDLSSPQAQNDLVIGFFSVLSAFLISGIGIGLLLKRMPESKLVRRFVLQATVTERPELAFARANDPTLADAAIGVAITDLRPAGRAQFGDRIVDVRSRGGWIASGRDVRVVGRDGLGLIVEEASA
jgi:membrane-bound ClpP family serine protease